MGIVPIARMYFRDAYAQWKAPNEYMLGLVVIGMERGRPIVLITRFVLDPSDVVKPNRITKAPDLKGLRVYMGAVAW